LVRGRKYRGGTPSGERAALRREPHPLMRTIGRHAPGGVLLPFYLSSMIRKSGYRFSEKIMLK
jgi:hypothetical protein